MGKHRLTALCLTGCLLVMIAVPALPAAADANPKDIANMNVLIVLMDATRADHLGCLGYARNTSPFIDSLVAQGTFFENAFGASSYTNEVISSLFTGLLPSMSGTGVGWLASPTPATENLAELFNSAGYVTALFTDHASLFDPAFDKGFCESYHSLIFGISGTGHALSQRALDFFQRQANRKTMVYVHYEDPHSEYEPPDSYYLRFASTVYPNPLNLYFDIQPHLVDLVAGGFGPGDPRFEDLKLRYDAEIAENDDSVKVLLEGLDTLGIKNNTLVVFIADHGEEFLEHGTCEHAKRLYRETTHVPLLFWAPGIFPAQRIATRVSTVNLLPTLLELAQIPNARHYFYGEPLFKGSVSPVFTPPTKPIVSELLLETMSIMHAVTVGDYKYIAAQRFMSVADYCQEAANHPALIDQLYAGTLPLVDPWGAVVHEELYNIANDPNETTSLISQGSPELTQLRQAYADYKSMAQAMPKVTIPVSQRPTLPDATQNVPALTNISPTSGPPEGGTVVTLTGTYLTGATVTFGGATGSHVVINTDGTVLAVQAPPHPLGAVPVKVTTPGLGPSFSIAFVYEYEHPTARFWASPTSGSAPLDVTFTDLSNPGAFPITQWIWDFGDGQTSNDRNPLHTYTSNNVFSVTLTVTSSAGSDSTTQRWYINVGNALPVKGGMAVLALLFCSLLVVALLRQDRKATNKSSDP